MYRDSQYLKFRCSQSRLLQICCMWERVKLVNILLYYLSSGTSTDGHHIIFRQSNTYSADFRFSALSHLEFDGMLVTSGGSSYYAGNVTRPQNSSFTWFHMNKGRANIIDTVHRSIDSLTLYTSTMHMKKWVQLCYRCRLY